MKSRVVGLTLAIAGSALSSTVSAQGITGVPGSPEATTVIDGRQIPPPPGAFGLFCLIYSSS